MSKESEAVSDDFMGEKFKSFVFENVGDSITGTVMKPPEKLQQTDINTGALKTWDDGKPKWYFRVTLATDLRDPTNPFDDGVRTLALSWKRLDAVRAAVRAAGAENIEVGGKLWLRFDGYEDKTQAKYKANPAMVDWSAKYKPPVESAEFMDSPAQTVPAHTGTTQGTSIAEHRGETSMLDRMKEQASKDDEFRSEAQRKVEAARAFTARQGGSADQGDEPPF